MRTAKTISITMPPELLAKAQQFAAKESRTMSELCREALRKYVKDSEWEALLVRTRSRAAEMGIRTEADVERLSDEWRREKRETLAGRK